MTVKRDYGKVYEAIKAQPGITIQDLAKTLEVSVPTVNSMLASMANQGYFISQDDYNGLYPMDYDESQ